MKRLFMLMLAILALPCYAAEPLKIESFKVKIISPEADVYVATLETIHNGDPKRVQLSYSLTNKLATIGKYGEYDIVEMGGEVSTDIVVTAKDGKSQARATLSYTRADMSTSGYYLDKKLWESAARPFLNKGESFRFVEADEKLPNVLLIGNSISIGYTPYVRKGLEGVANLYRIADNSGSTSKAVSCLDMWLSDMKWDVIHVNLGLHDLKYTMSKEHQDVPLDQYEQNLRKVLTKLQASGAKVIWASTTIVPAGVSPRRDLGDDAKYNEVARRVVKEFKEIEIDDLYKLSKENQSLQLPRNVHFKAEGYQLLGDQVVKYIKKALK